MDLGIAQPEAILVIEKDVRTHLFFFLGCRGGSDPGVGFQATFQTLVSRKWAEGKVVLVTVR